MIALWHQIADY